MRSSAISRRYAKALILIGKDDGRAEQYREELEQLVGLLDSQPNLEGTLNNPLFDLEKRKNVLMTLVDKLEFSDVVRSFLRLLFSKQRFNHIRGICEYYGKLSDELKGVVRADLVAATELSSESFDQIRNALSKMTGKEVILEARQDPELIGGVVTRIGDLVLDGSIKTQLKNMRESLKRGESV
ncbi:MAG: ATP synthase F1 subunit delta [Thermodesulfobacteriota bacterium]